MRHVLPYNYSAPTISFPYETSALDFGLPEGEEVSWVNVLNRVTFHTI